MYGVSDDYMCSTNDYMCSTSEEFYINSLVNKYINIELIILTSSKLIVNIRHGPNIFCIIEFKEFK